LRREPVDQGRNFHFQGENFIAFNLFNDFSGLERNDLMLMMEKRWVSKFFIGV
jgi:hypothetical protein